MATYGYSLMCEMHGPNELLAQASRAEEAGRGNVVTPGENELRRLCASRNETGFPPRFLA